MNDVFSESQFSALALSLEKGDCPVKFAYMSEVGASRWNEIEIQRAKDGSSYAEYELLRDNIDTYLQDIGRPNEIVFFDFGCGTGKTVKGMLESLKEKGIMVYYHGFDISEEIIKISKETLNDLGTNYSFNYTVLDFETFNLTNILFETRKLYHNIPVIGLLLGNTVGNFDSMERVITNITEAFRIQDRLVVGIEKVDISNQKRFNIMIEGYKQEYIYDFLLSTLEYVGVNKSDGVCNIIFNTKSNSVEGYFELNKSITINIADSKIGFEKGDKIRLVKSAKLDESQFAKLFLDMDLRIANMRTNLNNTFIEILLGAKKY